MEKERLQYPTSIFCIIATEFCERFSFNGLRTILSIYLRNELGFSENGATLVYHVFIMACYIAPIAGAFFADSIFGRFKTIKYFSIIYFIGNILMCVSAIPPLHLPPLSTALIGLLLISIGTGGIKPCVAAFGADQFRIPDQQMMLSHFFSVFYFTVILGGFVGMLLAPILRKASPCFGKDTCYALGFGFPAVLMALSLFLFMSGYPLYRVKTPKENIISQFTKCTTYALMHKSKINEHWLDASKEHFKDKLINDMKIVYSVLLLYIPLPIFWSLFDQQGSRWTFQASHMSGNIFGIQIGPDQIQAVNPALVLVLIPIIDQIMAICGKLSLIKNTLHRMTIGGMFAALAFLAAGMLEMYSEQISPKLPFKQHASLYIINTLSCPINLYSKDRIYTEGALSKIIDIPCLNESIYSITVSNNGFCPFFHKYSYKFQVKLQEAQTSLILIGLNSKSEVASYETPYMDFQKSLSRKPKLRILFIKSTAILKNFSIRFKNDKHFQDSYNFRYTKSLLSVSPNLELPPGLYDCTIPYGNSSRIHKYVNLALGGVYSLIISEHNNKIMFFHLLEICPPHTISMLWLLPQYFFISIAEILFGVSGLEFSFTQAPKSMKTITIAGWHFTVAIGNLIVIIVTQANVFKTQSYEYFLFAFIMVADMMIFIEMASHYRYVPLETDSSATL